MASKLVVHADRISAEKQREVEQLVNKIVPADVEVAYYNHNMEISWRDINKYAECTSRADMAAVNPKFMDDLISGGIWAYPLPSVTNANNLFADWGFAYKFNNFDIDISHMTNINGMFQLCRLETDELVLTHPTVTAATSVIRGENSKSGFYKKVVLNLPNATNISSICYHHAAGYLKEVDGDLSKVQNADSAFFAPYGHNLGSLLEFKPELPSLSSGNGMFNRQGLTKDSALRVLNSIPSYTSGNHPLLIGIHVDHIYDVDVNLALKKADINYEPTVELPEEVTEGKGWTLSVQWNGKKTVQASTFDAGTLIYAKVSKCEHPDGTTDRYLDWGHYVTNWEERGYEQFRSLEAAHKYFNVELPEND